MQVKVVARVQHHPTRHKLIAPLVVSMGSLPVRVVMHASEPPNPWHGYRKCLQDLPDCTHVLVVQDDTVLAPNGAEAVPLIAESNPDTPVVLWLSTQPAGTAARARQAMLRNRRYCWFGFPPYIPVVALLWPRRKAIDFLAWADRQEFRREPRADDGVVALWARATKQQFRVAVPSIVEHPDIAESVKGGPQKAAAGRDKTRVAQLLAEDALAYRW